MVLGHTKLGNRKLTRGLLLHRDDLVDKVLGSVDSRVAFAANDFLAGEQVRAGENVSLSFSLSGNRDSRHREIALTAFEGAEHACPLKADPLRLEAEILCDFVADVDIKADHLRLLHVLEGRVRGVRGEDEFAALLYLWQGALGDGDRSKPSPSQGKAGQHPQIR